MIDSYSVSDYKSTSHKESNSKTFIDMTMDELLAYNDHATKKCTKLSTRRECVEGISDLN